MREKEEQIKNKDAPYNTMDVVDMINTMASNQIAWSLRSIIDHAALVLVSSVGVTEALVLPLLLLGIGESVFDDMDDILLTDVLFVHSSYELEYRMPIFCYH